MPESGPGGLATQKKLQDRYICQPYIESTISGALTPSAPDCKNTWKSLAVAQVAAVETTISESQQSVLHPLDFSPFSSSIFHPNHKATERHRMIDQVGTLVQVTETR